MLEPKNYRRQLQKASLFHAKRVTVVKVRGQYPCGRGRWTVDGCGGAARPRV